MTQDIYGVGDKSEITSLMVRDAMVECFRRAHCEDTGVDSSEEGVNASYCREIVEKAFIDTGVDFEKPTKEGIMKVMGELSKFSEKFRNQEIIKKHYNEIMKLVNKLK